MGGNALLSVPAYGAGPLGGGRCGGTSLWCNFQ